MACKSLLFAWDMKQGKKEKIRVVRGHKSGESRCREDAGTQCQRDGRRTIKKRSHMRRAPQGEISLSLN